MQCEMCGKDTKLMHVVIEGVKMQVCENCSGHGTVLKEPVIPKVRRTVVVEQEPEPVKIEMVREDTAQLVRQHRERKGLTQKELAHKLKEKVSVIQHVEVGKLDPSITLARKYERFFYIELVELVKAEQGKHGKSDATGLTIGDLISFKK